MAIVSSMRVAWLVAAALLWVMGCASVEGPELLDLGGLSPTVVSAGDRIDLLGEGFPQGRRATVVFRGELRRPGSRPVEGVEITAAGVAQSSSHVVVTIDNVIARRFAGAGDTALHTTFVGDVRVIFPSRSSTAPPVVGTLREQVVDVVPTTVGEAAAEHEEAGRRFLAHMGLAASRDGGQGPLTAAAVQPGSPADSAGIRVGDVLARLDGLTVRGVGDLSVARGCKTAALTLRRPGVSAPFPVELDVSRLSLPAVAALAPAAVMIGIGVTLLCLMLGPLGALLSWLHRGVARANRRNRERASVPTQVLAWLAHHADRRSRSFAPTLAFVVTVGLFTLLGFGRHLVGPDVDLALITLTSVVVLVAGRLAEGGVRLRGSWSLLGGLRSAAATLLFVAPGLIGIVALAVATESVTLGDIAGSQGGSPWRWWALTNPGLAVGALCLLGSAVPTGVRSLQRFACLEGREDAPTAGALVAFARGAEWFHAWLTAALVATLYLGAWKIPLASVVWAPSLSLSALGCILFVLKLWATMLAIVAARTLAARLGVEALLGWSVTRLLPAAACFGALAVLWAEAADRWELPHSLAGALLSGVVVSVAAVIAVGLAAPTAKQALSGTVNPWL